MSNKIKENISQLYENQATHYEDYVRDMNWALSRGISIGIIIGILISIFLYLITKL